MSDDERIKRPALERTQPIRSWSRLLGGTAGPAPTGAAGPATSLNDVVARSVDLGYRVVEEYIRQGQNAAARLGAGQLTPETAARDVQDAAARMAQQASEVMTMWAELMGVGAWGGTGAAATTSPAATSPAPEPAPASRPGAAATPDDRRSTRLAIVSARPVEVQLDLRAPASGTLVVQTLRAIDPDKPALADVVLRPASGGEPVSVHVDIPAGHPIGVYRGLIVEEESSRLIGSLTVRIIA